MAWAALSSHQRLDIRTSLQGFNKVYQSAKSAVPYMGLEAAGGVVDEKLQSAINKWKEMDARGEFGPDVKDTEDAGHAQ